MRRLASAAAAAAVTESADKADEAGAVGGAAKRAANARWLFARSSFTCSAVAFGSPASDSTPPCQAGEPRLSVCWVNQSMNISIHC